jgi:8-oxo-dGTP pyrophosphatase MutT (NUDIX family)
MGTDGLGPQNLDPATPVVPRLAASVILLRGGEQDLQVLLVKRTTRARFMAGAWVFPGGAVDAREGADDAGQRAAAVRELREEAGVALPDPAALVKFSRWITPSRVRIRYDTHFFLAELPPLQTAAVDGEECVDLRWLRPAQALAAHRSQEILLVFPTIKHLEQLGEFGSVDALLSYARGREVHAVQPRILRARPGEHTEHDGEHDEGLDTLRACGEVARLVLPGEPGYDDLPA